MCVCVFLREENGPCLSLSRYRGVLPYLDRRCDGTSGDNLGMFGLRDWGRHCKLSPYRLGG